MTSPLKWNEVKDATKLEQWLSQAKITTTFWGGRAFKVDADKTGVNLNVVLAKIQDLRKKNLIDDSSLKNVINLFLERDITPMEGSSKAKKLYIARFWGNKQTAKRNEALSKLIGSLKEGADELRENQNLSQGLKEALKLADIDKMEIKTLYEQLIDYKTTPRQAYQKLKNTKGLNLEEFKKYLSKNVKSDSLSDSTNEYYPNMYLKGILGLINFQLEISGEQITLKTFITWGQANFSRKTCLALSKIDWSNANSANEDPMRKACESMRKDPEKDVLLFFKYLSNSRDRLDRGYNTCEQFFRIIGETFFQLAKK
jgi:hypothetical protein